MKRSGARLEHVWALGANAPLADLKRAIAMLLEVRVAVAAWGVCASPPLFSHLRDSTPLVASWHGFVDLLCGRQEFLLSEDLCEVASSLKELEIPHFHHEVVKRGMVLAMDKTDAHCEMMSTLFTFLFAEGVIAGQQFDIGFQRAEIV